MIRQRGLPFWALHSLLRSVLKDKIKVHDSILQASAHRPAASGALAAFLSGGVFEEKRAAAGRLGAG